MRRKGDLVNHSAFRCCFCCHVRTGTVILGIWHLILHVLALAILVSMLLRPELFEKLYGTSSSSPGQHFSGGFITHFRPSVYSHEFPDMSADARFGSIRDQDVHVALAITLCTGIITLLLLYGTIWAYVMGIVWSCYKYLRLRQDTNLSDLESDSEALLPPDYETAMKMPPFLPVYPSPPYAPGPQST
ncbi:lysosomal-associated transmembrane protein, putative [Ixodes scapularis]|uniref:Lysosomal-associated transmembrane protein, putative n=1 Tax=Ixodes scapularis TaxID=6945 RepID=B7QHE6_IXOSC|nr:lysosomal-associated transmembrane protein, putative [Ixodes scapularis]|eukprot:XP_002414604.1 lysosomal-associated transmembrane protein, putative [Ixodes scapularis]